MRTLPLFLFILLPFLAICQNDKNRQKQSMPYEKKLEKAKQYVKRIPSFKDKELKDKEYVVLAEALILFSREKKNQKEINEQMHNLVLLNNIYIIHFIQKFTNPFTIALAFEDVIEQLDETYLYTLFVLCIETGFYDYDKTRVALLELEEKKEKNIKVDIPPIVKKDFDLPDYDKQILQDAIVILQRIIYKILGEKHKTSLVFMPEKLKKWALDLLTKINNTLPENKKESHQEFYINLYNKILTFKTPLYTVTY